MKIAVLIFHGVELVDMNGPVDVFLHANRFHKAPVYNIYTVAATSVSIVSGGVVTIIPQFTLFPSLGYTLRAVLCCYTMPGGRVAFALWPHFYHRLSRPLRQVAE